MATAVFEVKGPFSIQPTLLRQGKLIDPESIKAFWSSEAGEFARERGIYIFALRAGRGHTPFYVGKTKRDFQAEAFGNHILNRYNNAMLSRKGTPVLFFLVQDTKKRGPNNDSVLKEIESEMIGIAYRENPELLNVQNLGKEQLWSIKGVMRASQGKPNKSESAFKKMMGI